MVDTMAMVQNSTVGIQLSTQYEASLEPQFSASHVMKEPGVMDAVVAPPRARMYSAKR
jgi:hypothetical protein